MGRPVDIFRKRKLTVLLLLPLSEGPTLKHLRTVDYLQCVFEAQLKRRYIQWLKAGKNFSCSVYGWPASPALKVSEVGAVVIASGSWFHSRMADGKKEHR